MKIHTIIMSFFVFISVSITSFAAYGQSFDEYFNQAITAYEAENYTKAINNLLAAYQIRPEPVLTLNVAKSYAKLKDCDKAVVYYQAFLREPNTTKQNKEKAQEGIKINRRCKTQGELSGRIFITSIPEADISLDGVGIGRSPMEIGGITVGSHEITWTKEGYERTNQTIVVSENVDQTLSQSLSLTPEVKPLDPVVAPKSSNLVHYILGGSITAVGLAVLGGAMYVDLIVVPDLKAERKKLRDIATQKKTVLSTAEEKVLHDEIEDEISKHLTLYAVGGTVSAIGVGYLIWAIVSDSPDDSDVVDNLVVLPTTDGQNIGISLSGKF